MISRCPSCGAPAPDEARLCRACGWDFVANKKGKPEPEKPKPSSPPPAGGLSLPPARGGSADVPATGLGMAKLPKAEPAAAAPGAADENPFALPVARNLGPKPGESLFAAPPPAVEPKLPEAKPKEPAPPPEKPKAAALPPAKPPVAEPEPEAEEPPKRAPGRSEPPKKIEKLTVAPAPEPVPAEPAPEEEEAPSAALFLPSSTDEIVVEPGAKRADAPPPKRREPEPEPEAEEPAEVPAPKAKAAPPKPAPTTTGAAKADAAGNRSTLFLAALTGGAMALLLISVGAIYMMVRSEPQPAARPMSSSPFGKRTSGDVGVTPVLDDATTAPAPAPAAPPASPAPLASSQAPAPTSLPAPAVSRAIEPPKPDAPAAAAAEPPKAAPLAPVDAPSPAAVAAAKVASAAAPPVPAPPAPAPASAPEPPAARPTATFAPTPRALAARAAATAKPKAQAAAPAPAPKKPAGPQWVFEGVVYDLLTTRGVYGIHLVFVDAEDNEVASIETSEGGHYHAAMKPGPATGYALRIVSEDYSGKHIDELDSTSSVRKADLEQRKFLMQAGARSLPWIGTVGKPVRRDMALVPKVSEE